MRIENARVSSVKPRRNEAAERSRFSDRTLDVALLNGP